MTRSLYHHGILGQRWGVRRYQNEDGSLTAAGQARLQKEDLKWAKKNTDKVTAQTKQSIQGELNEYAEELMQNPNAVNKNGKLSAATVNAYNKKMAELMNQSASGLTSPSGKVVRFVAKRGEMGVYMALADAGYDMSQLKNGVWDSGRIAYRSTGVEKADI